MINDDVVKCPLCGGFTHVQQKELLTALQDPNLRKQIEGFVSERLQSPAKELAGVAPKNNRPSDFQTEVHKWNPNVPMWRRSSKE